MSGAVRPRGFLRAGGSFFCGIAQSLQPAVPCPPGKASLRWSAMLQRRAVAMARSRTLPVLLEVSVPIVLVNLGIAVAYFALGRLGLLLALPPGYATAIWPPAGLACGACLIWSGRRVWPAIFLGSALTISSLCGIFARDWLAMIIAAASTVLS